MPSQGFQEQLVSLMPKLRVWALGLTRNGAAADDLVQEVAAKALTASDSFEAGTNFQAWMHRIMVNQFITGVRSHRECVAIEAMPDLPVSAAHEDRTALRELSWAVNRLPADQKEALLLIALEEKSYETASELIGCPVGTLKSRVHRARLQLRSYMAGSFKKAATTGRPDTLNAILLGPKEPARMSAATRSGPTVEDQIPPQPDLEAIG